MVRERARVDLDPKRKTGRGPDYRGTICGILDCSDKVRARGMCAKHYRRWFRSGTPGRLHPRRGPTPDLDRYREIALLRAEGHSLRSIAREFGITYQRVSQILHYMTQMGWRVPEVPAGRPPGPSDEIVRRTQQIAAYRARGWTWQRIADHYGKTQSAVICSYHYYRERVGVQ